jgi:hypothetical protein
MIYLPLTKRKEQSHVEQSSQQSYCERTKRAVTCGKIVTTVPLRKSKKSSHMWNNCHNSPIAKGQREQSHVEKSSRQSHCERAKRAVTCGTIVTTVPLRKSKKSCHMGNELPALQFIV